MVTAELHRPDRRKGDAPDEQTPVADTDASSAVAGSGTETRLRQFSDAKPGEIESLSTGAVLANVALTQGLVGVAVLVGAWIFGVPAGALGIPVEQASDWPTTVVAGLGLGVGLWLASESATTLGEAIGVAPAEQLRALLAPATVGGWIVLLALALPTVAIGEELLFRAAAIGVPAAGFGTSPLALALVSSIAFAFCHGIQGRAGIVITGVLGLVLAGAFVLTESLLLVIIAHYVLNATEFLVHEGLDVDPFTAWP